MTWKAIEVIWQFGSIWTSRFWRFWRHWWHYCWYGRHCCCHSLVTEHVGSNKRSVGCREIEFLLPGNNHHIIFIFVLLFLFLCSRKLTKKGAGPGEWGILLLYNYDNYLSFAVASLSRSFSLMRKNWPKKALVRVIGEGLRWRNTKTLWSRAWGRNWLRYERQFKLQSRISSSDAKCGCHTV